MNLELGQIQAHASESQAFQGQPEMNTPVLKAFLLQVKARANALDKSVLATIDSLNGKRGAT